MSCEADAAKSAAARPERPAVVIDAGNADAEDDEEEEEEEEEEREVEDTFDDGVDADSRGAELVTVAAATEAAAEAVAEAGADPEAEAKNVAGKNAARYAKASYGTVVLQ